MTRSEQIGELVGALAKAQAKIQAAVKDRTAKLGSYEYKYATLAGVWEVCRAPLAENALAVVQTITTEGTAAHITTLLAHSSGQWIEETLTMTAADGSPQKIGSAITYGRRYALGAMVGVVTDDDDDGGAAQQNHNGQGYQRPQKSNPPPAKQQAQSTAARADEESEALTEELLQAVAQAKDEAKIKSLAAAAQTDHKAHKLNDLQLAKIGTALRSRKQDLGLGASA